MGGASIAPLPPAWLRCARHDGDNGVVPARFYAPDARGPGDLVALPAEEGEHVVRVLRLTAGASLVVINGRGGAFDATIEAVSRSEVRVRVGHPCTAAPEPRVAVTLVQAVLKGDKMDDVVRDAVMMGAAAVQPVVTSRTEVSRAVLDRARRRERWQRIAVASAKQSGRATVPPVLDAISFQEFLGQPGAENRPVVMCVEPGASPDVRPLRAVQAPSGAQGPAALVVGPEGGWTPEEVSAAARTCHLVTLGGRTVRADAMGLVAISALFMLWGEYD